MVIRTLLKSCQNGPLPPNAPCPILSLKQDNIKNDAPHKNADNGNPFTTPRAKGMLKGMCVKGNTAPYGNAIRMYEMRIAPLPLPATWMPPKPVNRYPVALVYGLPYGIPLKASLANIRTENGNALQGSYVARWYLQSESGKGKY
jgi:hypothetical protein